MLPAPVLHLASSSADVHTHLVIAKERTKQSAFMLQEATPQFYTVTSHTGAPSTTARSSVIRPKITVRKPRNA